MSGYGELDAKAYDALETARLLPHGAQRSLAMKDAGRLRVLAEKLREQDEFAYDTPAESGSAIG